MTVDEYNNMARRFGQHEVCDEIEKQGRRFRRKSMGGDKRKRDLRDSDERPAKRRRYSEGDAYNNDKR